MVLKKEGANGKHTTKSSKQIWKGPATKAPSESPLLHSVNSINTDKSRINFSSQNKNGNSYPFNIYRYSVQSLSCVRLFETPWTAAHKASLSFTIFQSLVKHMSMESVIPSNHLILSYLLLLLPSVFPSVRVFSNGYNPHNQKLFEVLSKSPETKMVEKC